MYWSDIATFQKLRCLCEKSSAAAPCQIRAVSQKELSIGQSWAMNNTGYASERSDLRKGKEKEKRKQNKATTTKKRPPQSSCEREEWEKKNWNTTADTSAKLHIKLSTTMYEKTKTRTWLIMKLYISNSVINETTKFVVSLLLEWIYKTKEKIPSNWTIPSFFVHTAVQCYTQHNHLLSRNL